ncbi:MAG: PAS domain-containing protein, partial [Pseudomonadota bacterium]
MPRTRVSQTTARAGGEPILSPTLDIGNQISLGAMSSQATHSPTSSMSTKSAPRVPAFFTGSAFPLLAVLVLVCGTAGLAFATSGTGAPVILTLLALLAALGIFFLFGLIAGHVRVAERTTQTDVITQAFARVENGLIVTGPDGAVWQANTAAYDLLGLNEHADLRLLEHAFGHDADANAAMFRLSRAVERGLTRSEDVHLPEPGYLRPGRWVRISATPFTTGGLDTDASGATIWSLVDMTIDRARAEKTREKLERRVGLLETMPGGLIAIDGDDRLRHVSPQVSRWLQAGGLERDATEAGETIAAGERAAEMISGDGIDRIRAAAERARMAGDQREAVQPVDIDLIDNDGILRPATAFVGGANHDGVASTADADGRGGFLALIVPRQQTHDDAANVTDDPALRDVVRAAPFGLATLSADGIIISANTAFARLSQLSGGLAGRSAAALLSQGVQPDDAAKIKQALEQALAGKANIEPIDTTVGEDAARARRIFFASHTGGGDDAPRASIYVLDATEQRALERQFAQSQKMEVVGKLAGGIAHDFNNDLTAIIGFSDLLLSTHRPGDPAYPNIREINASANHAASLVSNLLAFSRQQQLQPEIIDVHDLITDQTVFLRQPLGSNIDFKVRPARDLWRIKADASELRRAIVNLVRNAADAMPDGGTLTLRTHNITERASARMADLGVPTGEYVAIEVADTGIGMAPEVME